MPKDTQDRPSAQKGEGSGKMTVEEAGHRGGQRVKGLVEGKEKEGEGGSKKK